MKKKKRTRHEKERVFARRYAQPGTPPGTLTSEAEPATLPRLRIVDYDADRHLEKDEATLADCRASLDHPDVTWIHVHGQVDTAVLETLGERFSLHPLALEDVLHRGQRPKWERYGADLFVILSLPRLEQGALVMDQISLFLGRNYLISFHEHEDDLFDPIRKRIRLPQQRFRGRGPDYLFYTLADIVIDSAFPVLEALGTEIEDVENELAEQPSAALVERIHRLKRQLVTLRRFIWPHRELIAALLRDEEGFVTDEIKVYLRDIYDHTVQVVDLIETYREMASGLLEIYLSSMSHRLNEVMRVLTVISTMFMPLTFLVGIYGMNFERMPELRWPHGYPLVWGVCIATLAGMFAYFRRRRWL